MDLMKWVNSLDDLLYEVMSWLIFVPVTLFRTAVQPLTMMAYADEQLLLPADEQYSKAISPPLFLAQVMLISSGLAKLLGQQDELVKGQRGLGVLIKDDMGALTLHVLVFAIFPLVMAMLSLWRGRQPLDRAALRIPFYAQCYPAAVFALSLSLGLTLGTTAAFATPVRWAGGGLVLIGLLYYLATQTRWFAAQSGRGNGRGFALALGGVVLAFMILIGIGLLFGL